MTEIWNKNHLSEMVDFNFNEKERKELSASLAWDTILSYLTEHPEIKEPTIHILIRVYPEFEGDRNKLSVFSNYPEPDSLISADWVSDFLDGEGYLRLVRCKLNQKIEKNVNLSISQEMMNSKVEIENDWPETYTEEVFVDFSEISLVRESCTIIHHPYFSDEDGNPYNKLSKNFSDRSKYYQLLSREKSDVGITIRSSTLLSACNIFSSSNEFKHIMNRDIRDELGLRHTEWDYLYDNNPIKIVIKNGGGEGNDYEMQAGKIPLYSEISHIWIDTPEPEVWQTKIIRDHLSAELTTLAKVRLAGIESMLASERANPIQTEATLLHLYSDVIFDKGIRLWMTKMYGSEEIYHSALKNARLGKPIKTAIDI